MRVHARMNGPVRARVRQTEGFPRYTRNEILHGDSGRA